MLRRLWFISVRNQRGARGNGAAGSARRQPLWRSRGRAGLCARHVMLAAAVRAAVGLSGAERRGSGMLRSRRQPAPQRARNPAADEAAPGECVRSAGRIAAGEPTQKRTICERVTLRRSMRNGPPRAATPPSPPPRGSTHPELRASPRRAMGARHPAVDAAPAAVVRCRGGIGLGWMGSELFAKLNDSVLVVPSLL